ncbi:hypothetical protein GCM10023144_45820 [Pigmentiphaga soli]|uniref:Type II secretion system protein M n=1 Tax=Pigmentiphaga soli TaxID=1007095 RepID=A0ABP8HRF1_9BURK
MNAAVRASWPAALRRHGATAAQRWARLAPRERLLLGVAGALAGLALVFLVLIEPAWTATRRLQAELPRLHTQAAAVDALVREARTLRRTPTGRMSAEETRQALVDSLRQAGIEARVEDAGPDVSQTPGALQVELDNVAAGALMQWLEAVPSQTRLKLAEAALERPAGDDGRLLNGKASGELLFVPATPEAGR